MAAGTVISKPKSRKITQYASLLESAREWIFQVYLDTALHFPTEVAVTSARQYIVLWSKTTKTMVLGELTMYWEDHIEKAYERKKEKYKDLIDTCKERGYQSYWDLVKLYVEDLLLFQP